jgi:hypothetical protein
VVVASELGGGFVGHGGVAVACLGMAEHLRREGFRTELTASHPRGARLGVH